MIGARWDKARYAVERKCTCRDGSAECAQGWHRVDGFDRVHEALTDAYKLGFDMYRVVDSQTGTICTY